MKLISIGALLLLLLTLHCVISLPTQLTYKPGQEFQYNLHGTVDARGFISQTNQQTNGTFSTLDSVLLTRCNEIQKDGSFIFQMNMFDTTVGVGNSLSNAKLNRQKIQANVATGANKASLSSLKPFSGMSSGSDSALGYDMYYRQLPNGKIDTIWYNTADDMYFVQVKISAISAFQTYVTASTANNVLEQDPLGVHFSNYQGNALKLESGDDMLTVSKQFNQQDVKTFSDKDVTSKNVNLNAVSQTSIHPSGYITMTSNTQVTTATSMDLQSMKRAMYTNSTGFDMNMRSTGTLQLSLSSQRQVPVTFSAATLDNLTPSNLFDLGQIVIDHFEENNVPILEDNLMESVLGSNDAIVNVHSKLIKLTKYYNRRTLNDDEVNYVKSTLTKFIRTLKTNNNKVLRDKLFYLLANTNNALFTTLFTTEFLTTETDRELLFHTLLASNTGLKNPTKDVVNKILSFTKSSYAEIRDASFLAFGSLLSRKSLDQGTAQYGSSILLNLLDNAMSSINSAESKSQLVSILGGIYNAGPKVVPSSEVLKRISKLNGINDKNIQSAIKMILKAFVKKYRLEANDSNYPYNKSLTKDYKVGGSTIDVDFHGELFIGTNFDCNNANFNYEGLAEVTADINVLGEKAANIIDAKANYAKQGSQLVADEIFLSVFGKVIYQKTLGSIWNDCSLHTYQLYHTTKGISVSYTVWVNIVPITFSVNADLGVNVNWGWQVCDAQLSAMIEVVPSASILISGNAEINLLIVRAGVDLGATFQAALQPQAYIHGTLCTVGIDVELTTEPMSAAFTAYFAKKQCKLVFFDCKWGKQDQKTLWSWSLPPQKQTLFNQEWKIQV
ncbi:hypothetical protein ABK040_013447 [Willaertia magna]